MNTRVITQEDHGEMNSRLLAREAMADFRRVESASRKIPVTLYSPEGKRLFIRYFNTMQLNTHFISVIARLSLPSEDIDAIEDRLLELIQKHTDKVNAALVDAENMCKKNGIDSLATYDIEPLRLEAKVISKLGRRYLELIEKVDQLMPMIETLNIDEIISTSAMNIRKAMVKRSIREVSGAARSLRMGLHKRINLLVPHSKDKAPGAPPLNLANSHKPEDTQSENVESQAPQLDEEHRLTVGAAGTPEPVEG